MKIERGLPHPLGATTTPTGVNFAIFSAHASDVRLCVFDDAGREQQVSLPVNTGGTWHGHVPGLTPGMRYGYRVHGAWDPAAGHRFNPSKLLLDPYARMLDRTAVAYDLGYDFDRSKLPRLAPDRRDNASSAPLCIVVDDHALADPGNLCVPWTDTILYELHVKGYTALKDDLPPEYRGTYGGLAHTDTIRHLKSLGVTSIELLPIQEFVDEPFVNSRGLSNFWGYNPIGFFMPTSRYAGTGEPAAMFRQMVRQLHDANIEVILDVVFNHTAEGGRDGPTFSFRGIDNAVYYRLETDRRDHYINDSGCGNSLNLDHPAVLRLVLDSLRFWVQKMGVDGFRFDLATSLGREADGFNGSAAFFKAIEQDPVLTRVKLIAEPWDLGPGGYQLGGFPRNWSEWNDRYRDGMRRFWRGDADQLRDFASNLHGGSDLFEHSGRGPTASVNFITSHDGFTLRDLTSFEHKHNELNLEENQDGHTENLSFNGGIEGATDDPLVLRWRAQQQRNLLTTLLLSQGVPMLLAGDELGRTQGGNNNAYCQDNPISYVDWQSTDDALLKFVTQIIALRRDCPEFRLDRHIHGRQHEGYGGLDEIDWYHINGKPMQDEHWHDPALRTVALMLHGELIFNDPEANLVLVYFNADHEDVPATFPALPDGGWWRNVLTTGDHPHSGPSSDIQLDAHSVNVFIRATDNMNPDAR